MEKKNERELKVCAMSGFNKGRGAILCLCFCLSEWSCLLFATQDTVVDKNICTFSAKET